MDDIVLGQETCSHERKQTKKMNYYGDDSGKPTAVITSVVCLDCLKLIDASMEFKGAEDTVQETSLRGGSVADDSAGEPDSR